MLLYNVTDVPTDALIASQLVNVSITVSGKTIAPGDSVAIGFIGNEAHRFISVGALTATPSTEYLEAKAAREAPATEVVVEEEAPVAAATEPPPASRRERRVKNKKNVDG